MSEPKRYAILGVVVEPSYNAEEVTSEMIAVPLGAWVRHDDYARLQAEVESLMTNPTSRLLRAERDENARLKAEVERLTTEVSYDNRVQLHIDKLATEFTQEQVERLTKAGDALADKVNYHYAEMGTWGSHPIVQSWREAKGVQS
jgi:hypothetical protein